MIVQKHFVEFFSPGTFVAETTTREIESWNVEQAMRIADTITERYGATPYAFQFITRERSDEDLDSKIVKRSPTYYLGGKVETLAEVEARNDPSERILRENMRGNHYDRIITNTNSYRFTQPLREDDVVLDYAPPQRMSVEVKT
jgi:hypothetical protein